MIRHYSRPKSDHFLDTKEALEACNNARFRDYTGGRQYVEGVIRCHFLRIYCEQHHTPQLSCQTHPKRVPCGASRDSVLERKRIFSANKIYAQIRKHKVLQLGESAPGFDEIWTSVKDLMVPAKIRRIH